MSEPTLPYSGYIYIYINNSSALRPTPTGIHIVTIYFDYRLLSVFKLLNIHTKRSASTAHPIHPHLCCCFALYRDLYITASSRCGYTRELYIQMTDGISRQLSITHRLPFTLYREVRIYIFISLLITFSFFSVLLLTEHQWTHYRQPVAIVRSGVMDDVDDDWSIFLWFFFVVFVFLRRCEHENDIVICGNGRTNRCQNMQRHTNYN